MGAMDKFKDKAQELSGQAKEKVGDATGDEDLQAEGQVEATEANLKQAGEKIKDAFS
jgi:uncharacterized protein YjbJ (UPF0337 family)